MLSPRGKRPSGLTRGSAGDNMPVCASRSFKTYIGSDNFITEIGTVTARTEADDPAGIVTLFDATNLQKTRLLPQYRTDDQALELDGTNDYAWVADHADFDITGDLTIECLFNPDDLLGAQAFLDKLGANDGYRLQLTGDELRLFIRGATNCDVVTTTANLSADTWYRAKAVYDASAEEISFFLDGIEIARATDGVQTNCTLVGNIPAAIGANAIRVTIGADAGGGTLFDGEIGFIGIDNAEHDNGGYLDPSGCAGYWPMDTALVGGEIEDVSGNDHNLTAISITSANFDFITTHAWVGATLSTTSVPTALVIDRRHNLTSSATVALFKGDWFSTYVLVDTATVVAGEAIVLRDSAWVATDTQWWIEVHDPTNGADFISLPYVWLGRHHEFGDTSIGEELSFGSPRTNTPIPTSLGNLATLVKSDPYRVIVGVLPDLTGTDLIEVSDAIDAALEGKPLLFGYDTDDEGEHTRIMYWLNALELRGLLKAKTPLAAAHWRRSMTLQELVAPAGYVG